MPATTKKKTTKAAPTKESGVVYIASTGNYFTAPEITADIIRDFQDNVYAAGLAQKQNNLIFGDKYWLEVLDKDGNQDEELELEMTRMCDSLRLWDPFRKKWVKEGLWSKIKITHDEIFWYGSGLFNDVWEYVDNTYTLTKLRHLPSHSFRTLPETGDGSIYSQILQGIILNDKKEIEYWQVINEDGDQEKIDNVFMVKDPTSTELAGTSIVVPLVPIISMLKFVWDTQMQQANRTGAKILFIKVTDPQPASALNNNVGDMDAAKDILKNWGKNTAFPLRGNMEIIDPQIKDDSNSLDIIEVLNQITIDYVSPISLMTAGNDSARLGGSDNQRMELLLRWIKSEHSIYEDRFSDLLQIYLDANGYVDYTVKLHIPTPEIDSSEIDLKRAEAGGKLQALTINEIRVLLGEEELSEEDLAVLKEYYESIQPAPAAFGFKEEFSKEPIDHDPTKTELELDNSIKSDAEKLAEEVIYALRHEQ